MKVLLLGSGGREHALAWKLAQSELVEALIVAPGNGGTAGMALARRAADGSVVRSRNAAVSATDFDAVRQLVLTEGIGLVVVGPEDPLVRGIVDYFRADAQLCHVAIVGPTAEGAQLEGSKDFAKGFMQRHGIPTARHRTFTAMEADAAVAFLRTLPAPYVLKADGLCAGKGVVIVPTLAEAESELRAMLGGRFGQASARVVVEEYLDGIECSVFALTDGRTYKLLPVAKDYKRIGEADTGPNTGGMGSVSPVTFADAAWMRRVEQTIVRPTVEGLAAEGIDYRGFIFFGLIRTRDGEPKVIEYNCRMGDPETETVMLRLRADLCELLLAAAGRRLEGCTVAEDPRAAVCVMVVSGGYPGAYERGLPIALPETGESVVFHAGTAVDAAGRLVTAGGRVVAVSSWGNTVDEARRTSLGVAARIAFDKAYYRRDIAADLIALEGTNTAVPC